MLEKLYLFSRLASLTIIFSALGLFTAHYQIRDLPKASEIAPILQEEPRQSPTEEENFTFTYKGTTYEIEPLANYQLSGLVVTHNDIRAFDDIYHTAASVDIMDLCVIWGSNVENDLFHRISFWSEPWSCHLKTDDPEAMRGFNQNKLSNNHLLTSSPEIQKKINSVHPGDQISLSGYLINYYPQDRPNQIRKSSLVRTDKGDGACEVVFVTDFTVIQQAKPFWHKIYSLSKPLFLGSLILKLILFCIIPYLEFRKKLQASKEHQGSLDYSQKYLLKKSEKLDGLKERMHTKTHKSTDSKTL